PEAATPPPTFVLRRPTEMPAVLARGPYLGAPTASSLRLLWRLDRPAAVVLRWGPADGLLTGAITTTAEASQVVTVTGLQAGTEYGYELMEVGRVGLLAAGTFRAKPGPDGPGFRFVVIGDTGTGSPEQAAVAGLIDRQQPDLILHTGDVVYQNGEAEGYDPTFFQPYRATLARVPFYPTMGNHDYRTANGAPYLDAFVLPANNPAHTERYYSFDFGGAHFTVLDSNQSADPASPMGAWLAHDLAATEAVWRFATFHHPVFSSGPHSDDRYVARLRRQLAPVLAANGVAMAFSGHEHLYERSKPQGGGAGGGPGVIYVVSGGGGARLYRRRAVEPWTAAFASRHHAVVVDVEGCRLVLKAVDPSDEVFDEMSLDRCRVAYVPQLPDGSHLRAHP
ncbi:MAG: metallophosphoesterase family protein, partial [Anaerolineae bacterium]